MRELPTIVVIIVYFGEWPPWMPLFLASCARNPTVDWQIYTDNPLQQSLPPNVQEFVISISAFTTLLNERVGLNYNPERLATYPYKLCDFKPTFGTLFEENIKGYDFFGYGDLDLLYGDLRNFYTLQLEQYDIISTRSWCISGHFALLRNEKRFREAYSRIPNAIALLAAAEYTTFDEWYFITIFRTRLTFPPGIHGAPPNLYRYDRTLPSDVPLVEGRVLAEELYTTPLSDGPWHNGSRIHPTKWYWYKGKVYNSLDLDREFIYVHFMNFKSRRYLPPEHSNVSTWDSSNSVRFAIGQRELTLGARIDLDGIGPLTDSDMTFLESHFPRGT